jgi:hypothetical protein
MLGTIPVCIQQDAVEKAEESWQVEKKRAIQTAWAASAKATPPSVMGTAAGTVWSSSVLYNV